MNLDVKTYHVQCGWSILSLLRKVWLMFLQAKRQQELFFRRF